MASSHFNFYVFTSGFLNGFHVIAKMDEKQQKRKMEKRKEKKKPFCMQFVEHVLWLWKLVKIMDFAIYLVHIA